MEYSNARIEIKKTDTAFSLINSGNYDMCFLSLEIDKIPISIKDIGLWDFRYYENQDLELIEMAMKEDGFKHASLIHLLAFGAQYPDEQKKGAILGFGSAFFAAPKMRVTPSLDYLPRPQIRILNQTPIVTQTHRIIFLAVRKVDASLRYH